jgi:hypothetical protein
MKAGGSCQDTNKDSGAPQGLRRGRFLLQILGLFLEHFSAEFFEPASP